ncbi:dTDP-4-amino-4,6-dideoxy-D-galactose acyltransferase [Arsenophonus nasoniae]|uniref:dTDP-fucosamine acetyltransferase n=1 Tax=Arsenophonus nasoniae TaxID=638 RepID=D2TWT7_9GAMM|nr:dTDP-4-amino-4,6-dideoxy-D-galactose acyltransferase [Arsenophonus nasoniae]QBY41695.1 dTDP-fucosamine acetyltransferase [Arsenophonus nasoniae]WGM05882.1 dTDP-4-amino-4,6-dideoxy-D-galactose acyltransferase [Arsenophonus nasoniae]WGM10896.1 dTDP-4-amino-4,6-dideoxy-D-galactose acyltransferase [Arsenophonus nasoniae]WGM15600.1 dTDP-4-amino-4,6-dideoxy-D-galactose acyltransferase [Arsenophonus nasoniae]CBA71843.1 lipopolysaccharide biosynthesis acetyltransferase [Arsenophonus nasoniae]
MSIHANIEILSWESDFFKRKTAKLHFAPDAPIVSLAQLTEYDLVQAKIATANTELIDAMLAMGFWLVESEIDFCLNIASCVKNHSAELVVAAEKDIELLQTIAATAFSHSRFRLPWYQLVDNARFYSVWLEKAVKGSFDDGCLLVKNVQGDIQGFVTLRKLAVEKEARIGLLATAPTHQGKGVGKQLMIAACQWCERQGVERLRIATQISNIGAMRLYSQMGAQIESTAYWLYRGRHDPI